MRESPNSAVRRWNRELDEIMPFHFFAGWWFAAAGLVPVGIVSGFIITSRLQYTDPSILVSELLSFRGIVEVFAFIPLPLFCAFYSGAVHGSVILEQTKSVTSGQAIFRGLKVGIWSWVIFVPIFCILIPFIMDEPPLVTFQKRIPEYVKQVMAGLWFVGIGGSILVGWLILLVDGIAGWLLFLFSKRQLANRSGSEMSERNR